MITRLPSNQKAYDLCWSGDPALQQPPEAPGDNADDADRKRYEAELEEYKLKLRLARERGDWEPLIIPGKQPTKFVMESITGTVYRRLLDRLEAGRIGTGEWQALGFRLAIKAIENFDDFKLPKPVLDHDYGAIAPASVVDKLDAIDIAIVAELGSIALRRAAGVLPKS